MDVPIMKGKRERAQFYGRRIANALKNSITESEIEENTPEENDMFMNTIKTKAPTILKSGFLIGTITSRARAKKDRFQWDVF